MCHILLALPLLHLQAVFRLVFMAIKAKHEVAPTSAFAAVDGEYAAAVEVGRRGARGRCALIEAAGGNRCAVFYFIVRALQLLGIPQAAGG